MTALEVPAGTGTTVCRLEQIRRESGVAALVAGEAVAVFRTYDDELFALSNLDPFSGASVLSRGIVGTRTLTTVDDAGLTHAEEVPFVASPLLKQPFDLRTGRCLDDPAVMVATYEVALRDDVVIVGARRDLDLGSHAR
ncbi:nitrite reductase small subunit NirD [Nocardioides sp.]|uniref:nitrite reductase small subunit NirD n=1 Tax=Nocardioides sp. TaxID=35761 RepID=UPI0035150FD1